MPLTLVPDNIPALPTNAALTYLDEGAANIVYRISIPYPSPSSSIHEEYGAGTPPPSIIEISDNEEQSSSIDLKIFDDKLLRLRKKLATAPTCFASQAAYLRLIAPLFNKNQLVEQSLVKVDPTTLIQRLNFKLQAKEKEINNLGLVAPRLSKRHGTYLAEDGYGLLVTDMTPAAKGYSVIEFKPKWLSQSPSAPPTSRRCRQCAYIACANAQHSRDNKPLLPLWCPLSLVSDDRNLVLKTAKMILHTHDKLTPFTDSIESFVEWIMSTPLLRQLRDNQVNLDSQGPLNSDAGDEKFRLAMTLRDVTAYLRFPDSAKHDPANWEARLGDLDIKSADKGPTWQAKEKELIDEGWYEAKERGVIGRLVTCYLEKMR